MNLLVMSMNGKKHIFKMVPGEPFSLDSSLAIYDHGRFNGEMPRIAKVNLVPLDNKDDTKLDLAIECCKIADDTSILFGRHSHIKEITFIKEVGQKLKGCTHTNLSSFRGRLDEKDLTQYGFEVALKEVGSPKKYLLSLSHKNDEFCKISKVINDPDFDFETAKNHIKNFSIEALITVHFTLLTVLTTIK